MGVALSLVILLRVAAAMSRSSSTSRVYNAFYRDILGSPRFFSAPMVDQSSLSWRLLVKRYGVDVAFSQMCHARNFKNDKKYRAECIDWDDYRHSSGRPEDEKAAKLADSPHIMQLAGDDPDTLVAAGKLVEKSGIAAIDLNCGCPQKIAKKGNYGAYLLSDPERIKRCLNAMVKGLDVPITVKIRRRATDEETLDLCQMIESCGVSMLTIHGRRVEENKLFTGAADWDIIKKVVGAVSLPVVANGGIETYEDAQRCLEYTGAAGVMSSEGLLENPRLFSPQGDALFRTEYVRAQLSIAEEYLSVVQSHRLPRPLFQVVRSHLFKFLYRMLDCDANQDLREVLSKGNFEEMAGVVEQLKERMSTIGFDTALAKERGMLGPTNWYYRHRDERAQKRIVSVPHSLKRLTEQGIINPVAPLDDETRLANLKTRLLEKRQNLMGATS
jgi:tRNA-dihydrouridine synthase 1